MEVDNLAMIILTAVITGGFTTMTTVAALKVHINYLREGLKKNESATIRAHARIDQLDKCVYPTHITESHS